MLQEATRVPTRTGEGARSATDHHVTESGAFTADEELAPDAAFSASFREPIDIGEGCAPNAYRLGAGTLGRRFKTCSRFTELRRPLLTSGDVVGSNLICITKYANRSWLSAFSGFSWDFGVVLSALRALHGT